MEEIFIVCILFYQNKIIPNSSDFFCYKFGTTICVIRSLRYRYFVNFIASEICYNRYLN